MLGNLKIGQRVNLGLILIFILFIALSVFHIKSMNRLSEQTIKIYEYPLAVTNAVLRIHANITRMHHAMKDITRSYDLMSDGMIMRKYEEIEVYDHIVDTPHSMSKCNSSDFGWSFIAQAFPGSVVDT
ncbi:hypothetical protein LCGC14_2660920 [marine sediment metagenome]|uniref:Uncharacterized protein n=1 Tax=marine sediment metagenome TaxID=412755 RepID=A0A0F8ZRZ7_9ZZZZ